MIEITVKTLDSQNHQFRVDDDITVEQFKSHIADKVNISAETQRIIYCGRVLQDSSKLADYDVNGKVVHLVQRAPPSATNPANRAPSPPPEQPNRRSAGFRGFPSRNTMYVGSMAFPSNLMESQGIVPPPPSHTLSASRLNIAKRMISRAMQLVRQLEDPNRTVETPPEEVQEEEVTPVIEASVIVPGESNEQLDEQAFLDAVQNSILHATQRAMNLDPNAAGSSGVRGSSSPPVRTSTPRRSLSPERPTANTENGAQAANGFPENAVRTREMATVMTSLEQLHTRLAPFLERVQNFMETDPVVPSADQRQNQILLNRVSEVYHYLGHAYHSLSDIILRVRTPPPRPLLCRPILIQHSAVLQTGIPIQVEAQINFSGDRPPPQQNAPNSTTAPASSTPAEGANEAPPSAATSAPAAGASGPTISVQHSAQPGLLGLPFIPPGAVRVLTPVIEIHPMRDGRRPAGNNNNGGEAAPAPAAPSNEEAPSGAGGPIGNAGGVEFLMEVTPDGVTYSPDPSLVGREFRRAALNGPPPELVQSLMQIINNQLMNRVEQQQPQQAATASAASSNGSAQSSADSNGQAAGGQNSQARGNTATNLTTSTNTRSTARPHVHMTQQAMQIGFDPFLPCNSHHISRRRQAAAAAVAAAAASNPAGQSNGASAAANGRSAAAGVQHDLRNLLSQNVEGFNPQAQARQEAAPQPSGTAPPAEGASRQQGGDGGDPQGLPSFARLFSTFTRGGLPHFLRLAGSTTINQLLQQFHQDENYVEAESLITDLVLLLSQNLTLVDTFSLSTGNVDPLNRIAGDLSTFIRTRVCENDTTPTGIENGIERVVRELRPLIDIFEHLPVRNDVDMPRTIERLFRLRLPIVLSTALNLSSTNVRELMDQLLTTVQHIFALSLNASSNGITGVEQVLEEFMDRSMSDIPRDIRQWTLMTSRVQLRRRVPQIQVPQNVLEQYIVKRNAQAPSEESRNAPSENSNDNTGSLTLTAEVESMDVEELVAASGSVPVIETIAAPVPMEETEPLPAVVLGSESWQVPEDWVPIITRDAQKQRRQNAQGPFSDAYLSGMPSKRRKLINNAKPQGTLPQVISDGVRQAVTATGLTTAAPLEAVASGAGQSQEIQNAYRSLLRTSVQANLRENEDFTPERFPNASAYFSCQPQQQQQQQQPPQKRQ